MPDYDCAEGESRYRFRTEQKDRWQPGSHGSAPDTLMQLSEGCRRFDLTAYSSSSVGSLGFDIHVAELTRFEDLAAFEALDVFRIFVSRDHLDSGMPTLVVHRVALRVVVSCVCWLADIHMKISLREEAISIVGYCRPGLLVVKHFSC